MKRTLIFLIFLALAIGVNAQTNAYDGMHIGAKATKTADSYIRRVNVNEADSTIEFYDKNGKLLNPKLNSNGWIDNADYFVSLNQDTVAVTSATATMAVTWKGKVIALTNATYQEITIPASTMSSRDVVTFIKYGAGPVRVNCAANVFRITPAGTDSCTMNTINQTYQIYFRTANKAVFIGDWRD